MDKDTNYILTVDFTA